MKNFRWDKKYLYWGITAFLVVVASITFFLMFNKLNGVVSGVKSVIRVFAPFIYGLVIAYLVNQIMKPVEKHIFLKITDKLIPKRPRLASNLARILSIIISELFVIAIFLGLLTIMLPQIFYSIVELVNKSQSYVEISVGWIESFFDGNEALEPVIQKWVNSFSAYLLDWITTDVLPQMTTLITSITGGVISIIKVVINIVLGLVISIYLLYNKEMFCAQGKKLVYSMLEPKNANKFMEELVFVDKAFGDYVAGTLLDAIIIGVVNYIFMLAMGMPYSALISIIVAVTNLIPMFGPFIGAVPSALLILLESPIQCLIFIIFTIVLQQLDGNLIKPKIHSSKSGISGFWIMFAILVFGGFFGMVGMILGVPIMTVLYSAIRRLNNRRLRKKGLPSDTDMYSKLQRIEPESFEFIYNIAQEDTVEEELHK